MRIHKTALLFFLAALIVTTGCKQSTVPTESIEKPGKTGQILTYEPYEEVNATQVYEGDPVAWFDDSPVFGDELERFGKKQKNRIHNTYIPHSGDRGPQPLSGDFGGLLDAYLDYRMMVKEAISKNLQGTRRSREYNHLLRLYVLAQDYRAYLKDHAPISADAIKYKLPEEWVQMNFAMKVFPSLEEAHSARAAIESREDYLSLKDGFNRNEDKGEIAQTALVWKGSGFFNEVDEGFLFQLEEGQISDPVETGLGLALLLVLERRDYSEEEKQEYIAKIRKELTASYLENMITKMNREGPYEINRVSLNQLFGEGEGPKPGEDELPVFTFEGVPVSLKIVTSVFPINFRFMMRTQDPKDWTSYAESVLRKIATELTLGLEAGKNDIPVSLPARRSLKENNERFLVDLLEGAVFLELADRGVSKEQTKTYYSANSRKFEAADTLFVSYYFSPFLGVMQPLADRVIAGSTSFEGLVDDVVRMNRSGEDTPRELAGLHNSDEIIKRKVVVMGDDTFPGFQEALFAMKDGSVRILRSNMGEFLFRKDGFKDGGIVPFDDGVHAQIASYLLQQKVDAMMDNIAAERRKDVNVRFSDDWKEIKGVPVSGTDDMG